MKDDNIIWESVYDRDLHKKCLPIKDKCPFCDDSFFIKEDCFDETTTTKRNDLTETVLYNDSTKMFYDNTKHQKQVIFWGVCEVLHTEKDDWYLRVGGDSEMDLPINYCPHCGRKLKSNKGGDFK